MPLEVLVRFGRWEEILAEPDNYPGLHAVYARISSRRAGRRLRGQGRGREGAQSAGHFSRTPKLVPKDDFIWGNNSCEAILGVVTPMVEGEILVAEGKIDDGIAQLRKAVAAEDALKYDEPPGWLIPVRHSLGAVLMRNRKLCGGRAGLSRRSRPAAGQRLVALRPGRESQRAKEERRRSRRQRERSLKKFGQKPT